MIAAFLAAALVSVMPAQVHIEAADAEEFVAYCSTNKTQVTRVRFSTGKTVAYRDARLKDIPFPGIRTKVSGSTKRGGRVIVSCNAHIKHAQVRLANGTRYRFTYPIVQPEVIIPPPPPVYVNTPPAKLGIWKTDVTLSVDASVEADWRVADMAALWQWDGLTVTTEPCPIVTGASSCIPVYQGDLTGLTQWAAVYGLAWQDAYNGEMRKCKIGLDSRTPSVTRPEIAAHEIGHCLGLPHWDTEGPEAISVMSGTVRAHQPTTRDLEWLHSS